MNNRFFAKLAASNIKKNSKTYIPYILTCVMTVAMFYIVKSLSMNPGLEKMIGGDTLTYTMFLGSIIVGLFAVIFLFYTNSFLVKRRKKEFGVFNILGMEKSHLAKTIAWENFYVTLISLAGGLILGIALDKAMYLLILQVIGADIPLGFFLSGKAILETVLLFHAIFLLIFLNAVRQIQMSNPIELLKAGNVGEKEPKTKILTAIAGVVCVGIGYYIALTTENPIASLTMFFVAVILVIVGTYMLFTAGSIALLKALRKNKAYYYKTKHFTSVSGMIYRMKQNAVGLANICILSTAVLVMVSSTSSLMLGMEDVIQTRYPNNFVVYADEETKEKSFEGFDKIRDLQEEMNLEVTQETQYSYLAFSSINDGDTFLVNRTGSIAVMNDIANLIFVTLDDYNAVMGTEKTLADNEILIYSNRLSFDYPVLKVFDKEYRVKETLDEFLGNGIIAANAANSHFIVVPDEAEIQDLPEIYIDAVISVEDKRFEEHHGVDYLAICRAAWNNLRTFSFAEGGSTITQQLMKNEYFTQEKKLERKFAEIFAAWEIEKQYSKEDIFELYVNTIYFGSGYYGIYDAAEGYFGKEPSELNEYEAIMLAGLPNAPSAYSPDTSPELAKQRMSQVLIRMVECEVIDQDEADSLLAQADE